MKILLVDDDPIVARVLARNFRQHRCVVDAVGDAESARARLAGNGYDTVIIDWKLQEIEGPDLIKELMQTYPQHHYFILTGRVASPIDAGGYVILPKASTIDELVVLLGIIK